MLIINHEFSCIMHINNNFKYKFQYLKRKIKFIFEHYFLYFNFNGLKKKS